MGATIPMARSNVWTVADGEQAVATTTDIAAPRLFQLGDQTRMRCEAQGNGMVAERAMSERTQYCREFRIEIWLEGDDA